MKYVLAIDQGTTGSRAIVYDRNGRRVAGAYEEFPQYFPKPGWVEHDPDEIWRSVERSIQKVLREVRGSDIAAIGITNQRETTVIWDRASGRPVHRAIVWQCRRSAGRCDRLKRRKDVRDYIGKRTGLPIDAYFSATKIEWILKNVAGARARAERGELCFGTTDSWVLWNLTGGAVHATDYTNASRTMLFDIDKKIWDPGLCGRFGVGARVISSFMPHVQRSSGAFGETVRIGKLPPGIPVAGIAGDQQAALFGQTCFGPGMMKNTYGTGCFMLMNTGNRRPSSRCGLITTIACGGAGEPSYALEGAIFIAGAAVQWLRDGMGIIESAAETRDLAESIESTGGVYFVPAFVGLGAPYWDQNARGAVVGITRGTARAHLVRAALEAMCYQTRDVLEAMRKDTGLCPRRLQVDGGAVANDFLCQFQADILGIDVVRPRVIETTSLGAAYLAGLSVGYWKNIDAISTCWKRDRVFVPRMSSRRSRLLYEGWKDAVSRVRTK
jgi:glycerol kinase